MVPAGTVSPALKTLSINSNGLVVVLTVRIDPLTGAAPMPTASRLASQFNTLALVSPPTIKLKSPRAELTR